MTDFIPASATAPTIEPTRADTSRTKIAGDFDTFLTLLTTQLQNQDPLSPTDPDKFTEQLVQFSQVEQQIETNSLLENLISGAQAQAASTAVSYLGKEVVVETPTAQLTEGEGAAWSYFVPKGAVSASLRVTDAAGRTVISGQIDPSEFGQASGLTWDGVAASGEPAAPGPYTLTITARDADGKAIDSTITVRERVIAVDLSQGDPLYVTPGGPRRYDEIVGVVN